MSDLPDFPFLPGVAHQDTWHDDAAPPQYVTLTLDLLAMGARPEDDPPDKWVKRLFGDGPEPGLRHWAEWRLKVFCTRLGPGLYSWMERSTDADGSLRDNPIISSVLTPFVWKNFSQCVIDEAVEVYGSVAKAVTTIERMWTRAYEVRQQARLTAFIHSWQHAASWQPGLALAWLLYGGNWELVAEAVKYGRSIPEKTLELAVFEAVSRTGANVRNRNATAEFSRRSKLSAGHPERIVLLGVLMGKGPLQEIDPRELVNLDWGDGQGIGEGAVLRRDFRGQYFYTNVVVDRLSVVGQSASRAMLPGESKKAYLRRMGYQTTLPIEDARALARETLGDIATEAEIRRLARSLVNSLHAGNSNDRKTLTAKK